MFQPSQVNEMNRCAVAIVERWRGLRKHMYALGYRYSFKVVQVHQVARAKARIDFTDIGKCLTVQIKHRNCHRHISGLLLYIGIVLGPSRSQAHMIRRVYIGSS